MTNWSAEVRPGRREDDEQRDAFVQEHRRGTFFHLSGWRRTVEAVFGHEGKDLMAFRDGDLVGLMPLMRVPGFVSGCNLISVPYAVYGGALGESPEDEQELVESAVRLADKMGVGHLELRYQHDPGPELVGTQLYWTFVRELPATIPEVLQRMPKKARAEARKARERHQLELTTGEWYVDDLYRMFLLNKHSLGSPGMPSVFFYELLRQLPRRVQVHLVRQGSQPVAAVMSFAFRDTLIAYYSGTMPGVDRSLSASNFMYMALQEWAVEQGFRHFDFGRSRRDAGAFQFKLNQGFEPAPLNYRFHLVRNRGLPSFNPSNPKTELLRQTWSRLPLWLVRRLSNGLSKYLG